MPHPFPHRYETQLKQGEGRTAVLTSGTKSALTGGPPPQFDGKEEWWSPEELFLESINLCLFTPFQTIGTKKGLELHNYASRTEGVLDKTKDGLTFTKLAVHMEIKVAEKQVGLATEIVDMAKRYCVISNALKIPVEVHSEIKG